MTLTPEEQADLDRCFEEDIKRERNEEYLRESHSAEYDTWKDNNYDELLKEYVKDEVEGSDEFSEWLKEKYNDAN